jgi:hypothetical protein
MRRAATHPPPFKQLAMSAWQTALPALSIATGNFCTMLRPASGGKDATRSGGDPGQREIRSAFSTRPVADEAKRLRRVARPQPIRGGRRAAAALLLLAAAAALPARAVEPPGSKNFTAPPYVPDYFSNESGPFHTGARARPAAADAGPRSAAPTTRARTGGKLRAGGRGRLHRHHVARRHVYRRLASKRTGHWRALASARRRPSSRHRTMAPHEIRDRRHRQASAGSLAAWPRPTAPAHRHRTRAE